MQTKKVQDGNLDLTEEWKAHILHVMIMVRCSASDCMSCLGQGEALGKAAEINPKKLLHSDHNVSIV